MLGIYYLTSFLFVFDLVKSAFLRCDLVLKSRKISPRNSSYLNVKISSLKVLSFVCAPQEGKMYEMNQHYYHSGEYPWSFVNWHPVTGRTYHVILQTRRKAAYDILLYLFEIEMHELWIYIWKLIYFKYLTLSYLAGMYLALVCEQVRFQ